MGPVFSITQRNRAAFRSLCETIQADHGAQRPLLLKNPWDYGNDRVIRQLMPDAWIIYIHRNPFHVLSSMIRIVDATVMERNPYLAMLSRRYRSLTNGMLLTSLARRLVGGHGQAARVAAWLRLRTLLMHVRRATTRYLACHQTADNRRVEIAYEQLCDRPGETVAMVLAKLGLAAQSGSDVAAMVRRSASRVAPEVFDQRYLIARALSGYGRAVGFDMARLARALPQSPRPALNEGH